MHHNSYVTKVGCKLLLGLRKYTTSNKVGRKPEVFEQLIEQPIHLKAKSASPAPDNLIVKPLYINPNLLLLMNIQILERDMP